jgi:hypothetical protein
MNAACFFFVAVVVYVTFLYWFVFLFDGKGEK